MGLGWQEGRILLANSLGRPSSHGALTIAFGSVVYSEARVYPDDARLMNEKSARNSKPPTTTSGVNQR